MCDEFTRLAPNGGSRLALGIPPDGPRLRAGSPTAACAEGIPNRLGTYPRGAGRAVGDPSRRAAAAGVVTDRTDGLRARPAQQPAWTGDFCQQSLLALGCAA